VTNELFASYKTVIDGEECFFAGLPGYPRNFSRDTIIAGIIADDPELLESQFRFSRTHQGQKDDIISGEEHGKIHHEYPGVVVNESYLTTYNGCDTTALYLIAAAALIDLDQPGLTALVRGSQLSLEAAANYIRRHTDHEGIFWEYPPAGAKHFSLRTTYWKDSIVPSASGKEEPAYPAAFSLVQFQNARGLLAAARILNRAEWKDLADLMFRVGIEKFTTSHTFCLEIDQDGRLEQVSSDELHALAYIPPDYYQLLPLDAIRDRAEVLITPAGIACTPRDISAKLRDKYHGYVVWMFEQALIHYGCEKFGLHELAEVTRRCVPHIGIGQELVTVEPQINPEGNDRQLWSVATRIYFSDAPSLRRAKWL
jgi:hypothetical protein